jgi:hypothetical protein
MVLVRSLNSQNPVDFPTSAAKVTIVLSFFAASAKAFPNVLVGAGSIISKFIKYFPFSVLCFLRSRV